MPEIREVLVPDIGNFDAVDVIEVFVKPGDTLAAEDSVVTLESDKASMDVPSPVSGTVKEVKIAPGAKVSQGTLLITVEVAEGGTPAAPPAKAAAQPPAPEPPVPAPAALPAPTRAAAPEAVAAPAPAPAGKLATAPEPGGSVLPEGPSILFDDDNFDRAYASPAIRRFARELGVDLGRVGGTGRKGRIVREDVQGFVKKTLAAPPAASGGLAMPPAPEIDFSRFGPVEAKPLSRLRRAAGANLHRAWVTIPHVTQHEETDITELEAFRKQAAQESGTKLTLLAFLIRAAVASLRQFPDFNASLSADGESLILKGYFHIGVAVDTPGGLVVPVIKNADQKGLLALAAEVAEVAGRAREGKLRIDELSGGCFSISSLGGLGGTAFTPIINAPEVAILGVSRAAMKPVWQDGTFVPRLMLPLSLSYDHRVIDGAAAVRFVTHLARLLSDVRRLLL
ncbi:MAG TPA: dihydrolipoyllysine-residue acetyltransferase [Thermoanaerobaculia bacterium]|nr:dihydrolipoyllysine-residue acetyltransferase [Thermoanaerobaculia bacterium]